MELKYSCNRRNRREALLYLVDRYGEHDIYEVDFDYYHDYQQRLMKADKGLKNIDHLTHNVQMATWINGLISTLELPIFVG